MKYIASCSGGKDSLATIILAHEKNEPLDYIVFSEVMFDETTSGEFPEHIEFIHNKVKPLCESWGYKFEIVRDKKNFLTMFNHIITRSKDPTKNGRKFGFPIQGRCHINGDIKVPPIHRFKRAVGEHIDYIGIAADEKKRLARLKPGQISLLDKHGYTEADAFELCKKYDLISPIYEFTKRGGCWFCPNNHQETMRYLRDKHPSLWHKLQELENDKDAVGNIWASSKKTSVHELEARFKEEDKQLELF
jgi:3'-phosphoadenosine 5'-phosphosulfate sulfotransferase (PAPS reductase)/FAD synthetase